MEMARSICWSVAAVGFVTAMAVLAEAAPAVVAGKYLWYGLSALFSRPVFLFSSFSVAGSTFF